MTKANCKPFRQTTYRMGEPRANLDKALTLAAALEDEEIAAKLFRLATDTNPDRDGVCHAGKEAT